jgi:hypothetical protein
MCDCLCENERTLLDHKELLNNLLMLKDQEIVLMAKGLNRFQDM